MDNFSLYCWEDTKSRKARSIVLSNLYETTVDRQGHLIKVSAGVVMLKACLKTTEVHTFICLWANIHPAPGISTTNHQMSSTIFNGHWTRQKSYSCFCFCVMQLASSVFYVIVFQCQRDIHKIKHSWHRNRSVSSKMQSWITKTKSKNVETRWRITTTVK